jgi:hypothetical protein
LPDWIVVQHKKPVADKTVSQELEICALAECGTKEQKSGSPRIKAIIFFAQIDGMPQTHQWHSFSSGKPPSLLPHENELLFAQPSW